MDIEILQVAYAGPTYVKVKVLYFNRHLSGGNMLLWPRAETVRISSEQYKLWERVQNV
jgi:hypothetical protein